ncbi:Uncharacterised protein [Vibrio cholerae]|nr:Uncharacterised protein [Vibrio cholerae]
MSRGVDYVKTVTFPETGSRSRLDSDTTLSFLFHEVHR